MSDLDKLMNKLKKPDQVVKPITKKPIEEVEEVEEEYEDEDDEEFDGEEEVEVPTPIQKKVIPAKQIPVKEEVKPIETEHDIADEVALLQNDGVFRRELLLTLKEFVDVHKINTQTLMDLKKIIGGEFGKK